MADSDCMERNKLITLYFDLDYSYKEILGFMLGVHHIILSLRQLKHVLATLGLFRRKYKTPELALTSTIKDEVSGDGCNLRYRAMHHKLHVVHGIRTSRELVRKIIKEVDPGGVEGRSHHRLKRRRYICSFSRKILWLHVASTNNDPKLIANYYVECVSFLGGTACRIRSDRGTENVNVEALQKLFRSDCRDAFAGEKSFMYGKSTSNQDMTEFGELNDTEFFKECSLFCFADLIQEALDKAVMLHNSHRIRPYTYQECPAGKPDIIFQLPEVYGSSDYLVTVNDTDIELGNSMVTVQKNVHGCSDEFAELFNELMQVFLLDMPKDSVQARNLYNRLMNEISSL